LADDGDNIYVDFVRDGLHGKGEERMGDARWRRITEVRAKAKSVFHFDVQAKSPNRHMPVCRGFVICVNKQLKACIFGPFDGWGNPMGYSAIVEAYPSLYKHAFAQEGRHLISRMPMPSPPGCNKRILVDNLQNF